MLYRIRVSIEGFALFVKCISTYALVSYTDLNIIAFGLSQIIFALLLSSGHLLYMFKIIRDNAGSGEFPIKSFKELFLVLPFRYLIRSSSFSSQVGNDEEQNKASIDSEENIDNMNRLAGLVFKFYWWAVEILLLQEGEKIVLKFTESLVQQGVFSVAQNLGSMVARFLFQPIEEMSFNLFSKLIGGMDPRKPINKNNSGESRVISSEIIKLESSEFVLRVIIHFTLLLGLIFVCFGSNYCYLLLQLLYGGLYDNSTGAPLVLSWYCLFVLFMALNGMIMV